jgi:hypothetical protein
MQIHCASHSRFLPPSETRAAEAAAAAAATLDHLTGRNNDSPRAAAIWAQHKAHRHKYQSLFDLHTAQTIQACCMRRYNRSAGRGAHKLPLFSQSLIE